MLIWTEIIPKFTCLLNRGRPVVLHGDGSPTRRYLYAGDAADAFDTILHKGQVGQIYNVGSYDEISNFDLCGKLLTMMNIPQDSPEHLRKWIKYTHDRPFNDRRYAVDATKLRQLGWDQKTTFEEGLKITVDWYSRFGEAWWGDISHVLTPFPLVSAGEVVPDDEHSERDEPLKPKEGWVRNGEQKENRVDGQDFHTNGSDVALAKRDMNVVPVSDQKGQAIRDKSAFANSDKTIYKSYEAHGAENGPYNGGGYQEVVV